MNERPDPGRGDQNPVEADEIDLRDAQPDDPVEEPDTPAAHGGAGGEDPRADGGDGPDDAPHDAELVSPDDVVPGEPTPAPEDHRSSSSWASRAVGGAASDADGAGAGTARAGKTPLPQPAADARMEPFAVASLVLGLAAMVFLPPIFGGLAVYLSSRARRKIIAAEGALRGGMLARIGMILGWLAIILWVLLVVTAIAGGGSSG